MARSLVDTNILVYAQDRKEAIKRPRAVELIDRLSAGGEFVPQEGIHEGHGRERLHGKETPAGSDTQGSIGAAGVHQRP